MGIKIGIHCEGCGWTEGYRLGLGSGMYSVKDTLALIPSELRIRITELIQAHPEHTEDFEYRLYRCPLCGHLFERMHVAMMFGQNRYWESGYTCPDCASPLEMVTDPEEIPSLACPICGKRHLAVEDCIFWD
ncbi:MAG: hypothetical protein V3573_03700 [Desulfovibrionaceae bacterium]